MRALLGLACMALVAGCGSGGPQCTDAPQSGWMSEAAMKRLIDGFGYRVNEFKVSGSCYEIYGWDRQGRKVEVYFNPVSGAVVKSEVD